MQLVATTVLLAVLLVWRSTGASQCGDFTRCSECVFDSSDGVLSTPLLCSWCASSSTCVDDVSVAAGVCPDIRNMSFNPTCPDMQCSAAYSSNNIYFCRGPIIAALIFGIILALIDVLFFMWLKALWQLPWKYANINQVVADYITRSGSILGSLSASPVVDVTLKSRAGTRTGSSCPICKNLQADPLGPGEVCFWCDVARNAFIPFYIGIIGAMLTILLIFCLPLKPWFSDWYYAFILVVPYAAYTLFVLYISICRVSIVGDSSQKTTTFFQLAWVLRGRSIKAVFPHIDNVAERAAAPATAPAAPSSPGAQQQQPQQQGLTEEYLQLCRSETMQLLNLDILPKEFCKLLQAELVHDECILWWSQPTTSDTIKDMKWLIHALCTAVALGVWFWIAASVTDKSYPIVRMIDSSSLSVIGTVVAFMSMLVLLVTIMGCSRLYVLTNRRLLIVAGGVLGAHAVSTEIGSLKYASIFGYTEWNSSPVLTFSWETPAELRKMPPISTKAFPAIDDVDGFLAAFYKVAPRLSCSELIRENVQHNRSVWRMHIFINSLCLAIIPIVVIYSQIAPGMLDVFLLLIIGSLNVCIIQRGMRHQQITYAPLDMVDAWAHWDESGEGTGPSFFSTLIKDGQVHWMGKPEINLPKVTEIAEKVRAVTSEVAAHAKKQRES